jgi:1-acyl-sn-glycerol-3-phosphate acyltransferase
MTVVSKASLKYLGPFGFVAQKCGVVFIDRKQGKQSHEIIQVGFYVKATQTCWGK